MKSTYSNDISIIFTLLIEYRRSQEHSALGQTHQKDAYSDIPISLTSRTRGGTLTGAGATGLTVQSSILYKGAHSHFMTEWARGNT